MKIDLSKYLINKDKEISNDDFDIEKLGKDLYKGYTSNTEVDKELQEATKGLVAKSDFDKLQNDYTKLEDTYNNTISTLNDTNAKMARVTLESKLTRKGFKESDFDDVINIRESIYKDEKDDNKAIEEIAEKFKNTFFPTTESKYTTAPNETPLNSDNPKLQDIKITRDISIKDLLIKK